MASLIGGVSQLCLTNVRNES